MDKSHGVAKFITHISLEVISSGCNEIYMVLLSKIELLPASWNLHSGSGPTLNPENKRREKSKNIQWNSYVWPTCHKLQTQCSPLQSVIYSFIVVEKQFKTLLLQWVQRHDTPKQQSEDISEEEKRCTFTFILFVAKLQLHSQRVLSGDGFLPLPAAGSRSSPWLPVHHSPVGLWFGSLHFCPPN